MNTVAQRPAPPATVMNAINDALRPFGAKGYAQPFTPERILAAMGKVAG